MAANPNSNIHNDTWMTDAYQRSGPLGNNLQTSSAPSRAVAVRLARLRQPRAGLVSVCPSLVAPPQARIIDPVTLEMISSYVLPTAPNTPGTQEYQNFTGGGYFFLDDEDRIWVPTKTDHIYVIGQGADGNTLTLENDYDLTSVLDADDRADQLGAAGLQRPDLVRLEGQRQGRHARTRRPARSR